MANEIGTTLLNGLTNSSFNLGEMSKTLAEAEVAGKRSFIEKKQESATTELDAIKYLQTNLNAFQSYVTELSEPDLFETKAATSSDESVVTVSSTASASPGSYQIESVQLAQRHTAVATTGFASPSSTVGSGDLNITVNGQSNTLTIDNSNNTLEGIRNSINNGDFGVSASIVNNGGNYQMMFTSKTDGAAGEIDFSGSTSSLVTAGMTVPSQARDAEMKLNGFTLSSSTNTFDNAIDGVSFNLNSVSAGAPTNVTVSQDTSGLKESIKSFVDVYNQLDTILEEVGAYDQSKLTEEELESDEYKFYGDLAGSSLLRTMEQQIRGSMTGAIDELNNNFNSLAVAGISFDSEGQLELDEARLDEVMANNIDELGALFSKGGSSSDPLVDNISGSDRTVTGSYDLNITQVAERASLEYLQTGQINGATIPEDGSELTLAAGAAMEFNFGGNVTNVDLSAAAGAYATRGDMVTAIQTELDSALGAGTTTLSYDNTASRFVLDGIDAPDDASVTMTATNLGAQGFTDTTERSFETALTNASFNVSVDGSDPVAISLADGTYTAEALAQAMTSAINNNDTIKASSASLSVTQENGRFTIASSRFGGGSQLEMSGFQNMAAAGFDADQSDTGQNVDGTLTNADGVSINIGAYASQDDGRKIKISDFAVGSDDEPADMRGLSFEVLGGTTGDRGQITYAKGFASRLNDTVTQFFEEDTGLVSRRMDNLDSKLEDYREQSTDLDDRYEMLLKKYQLEFSALQSILSNAEQTRNMLSARFGGNE